MSVSRVPASLTHKRSFAARLPLPETGRPFRWQSRTRLGVAVRHMPRKAVGIAKPFRLAYSVSS